MALLDELGAPVGSLQLVQGQNRDWWHPGRSARLQLGPKTVIAEFGELHPRVLKALDADGPDAGLRDRAGRRARAASGKSGQDARPALTCRP